MSKYIIELDDRIKLVTSVGVTESGVVYTTSDYVHNLEELNSDYINEHYGELQDEAYQRGHDDGYEAGCATAFKPVSDAEYQRGYDEGYKKCLSENDFDQPCVSCKDYQRGLDDAWEAARKIALMDTETSENVTGYFGLFRIMENLTPMQAIEKLKAYEDKQKAEDEIKVGDEVISLRKNGEVIEDISPWIVTYETKYAYQGFDACGMFHNNPKEIVRKTGKHYDIASILEAMRTHD